MNCPKYNKCLEIPKSDDTHKFSFEIVELKTIKFTRKTFDNNRLKYQFKIIELNEEIEPISLEYDNDEKIYLLRDGNHRSMWVKRVRTGGEDTIWLLHRTSAPYYHWSSGSQTKMGNVLVLRGCLERAT